MIASATESSALASPLQYSLLTTIAVPASAGNPQPGGAFTSFDIGFVDPTTGLYFLADRSNASVDIFSGSSLSFIGRAPGFAGQQPTTSSSGPNGVLVVGTTLFAGDGNSTVLSFNVSSPAAPTPLLPPINTGGSFRADKMSYSPSSNLILVANNADNPAFATLVNATTGAIAHAGIVVPGAIGGLGQSVWNSATGTFFITVPQLGNSANPGGVAEITTAGTIGRIYDFASFGIASCSPTGLALGASGNLMVGCGSSGTQTILLNPTGSGSIVTTLSQISGSDEVWFDPSLNDFFVTGLDGSNARVFDIISDISGGLLQSVMLPDVNAHSIAVDPLNGDVFVPLEGTTPFVTDALCPLGCVAVYASEQSVPEPDSLHLLLSGLLGLVGASIWLRRSQRAQRLWDYS